jgi:hypothetical protein
VDRGLRLLAWVAANAWVPAAGHARGTGSGVNALLQSSPPSERRPELGAREALEHITLALGPITLTG